MTGVDGAGGGAAISVAYSEGS
ncbi:protein of unknown function [Paraburkholderia kururiensis]